MRTAVMLAGAFGPGDTVVAGTATVSQEEDRQVWVVLEVMGPVAVAVVHMVAAVMAVEVRSAVERERDELDSRSLLPHSPQ